MAIVSSSVALHVRHPKMERRHARSLGGSSSSPSPGRGVREIEEEVVEAPMREEEVEKVFVAVGKEFKEGKTLINWVLQNSTREKKIVLAHVHRPAHMIPLMGGKFPASQLTEQQVNAYWQIEKEKMNKTLDEYLLLCSQLKFQAEKLVIEMDDVSKGLIELISQHRITKLVMGAAADKQYSRKMKVPKSKTAINVQRRADPSCKIWFVCKGNLICTRDGDLDGYGAQQPATASPSSLSCQSEDLRSRSLPVRAEAFSWLSNPLQELFNYKSCSNSFGSQGDRTLNPMTRISSQGSAVDLWDEVPSGPQGSSESTSPMTEETPSNSGQLSIPKDEESEVDSVILPSVHESDEDVPFVSPQHALEDTEMDDEVYQKLQHALTEAENSRREAYEESCRRRKAERDAMEAVRKAKASENLYVKEMKQRKETEETLAREKLELEKLKNQRDQASEKLRMALEQKVALETRIADSHHIVKDFEEKLSTAQCLLNSLQKEHDELLRERDNAIREAEELRQRKSVSGSIQQSRNFIEFSYIELQQATQNFDESLKIGEGGYGSVYKGFLRHTTVAIKKLNSQSRQGEAEFQQELDVLSKVRHPNLVILIGACVEERALVYEFLPNGCLEDRLVCKDNSAPLTWQVRTLIAAEICAALTFLHSNKPHSVVHGDLKPANILLDANFVSKLGDFGICRLLLQSNDTTNLYRHTHPKGTFVYMDPEFISTGQLTPRSDTYSFGVILLRLLTRRPPLGIVREVQEAIEKGCLHEILDPLAGDWPFVQAKQLAQLGLRCCEISRKNRPDLGKEVWKVLEPLAKAVSNTGSLLCHSGASADDSNCIPSYFLCPIFQEIMKDPHIASDGFTYEAEAIRGWLDSGHETSPMTNLKLPHRDLVPNLALRSAIQEWMEQQK
ncbi:hypothetical protein J5N97_023584 [Dioscorea zingiberensis]|uniref:RING-type E3 ubiquitin transferase n=1 Tax=Dioscorea zingiberensis TaxID=325984 RepID=A0A9D5C523_9LILI|nr:hypothetical protein J5N97_023584 [Dioscorea zingiberensis]